MLNNINEIKKWLIDFSSLEENDFEIININNNYVVNVFKTLNIDYDENIGIPIKFNKIDGTLNIEYLHKNKNKSFDLCFFPKIINGNLSAPNIPLTQDMFKNWETKEINGEINFCSYLSNLKNLDFLVDTNFKSFVLKLQDTPFEDNIIPEIYKNVKIFNTMTKNEFDLIIGTKFDILNYFDFDNTIELNKDK